MCSHAAWGDLPPVGDQGVPLHVAEIAVSSDPVLGDEDTVSDVVDGEVRDGVAARFVEQKHVLAVGDPLGALPCPHAPAERFDEQQSVG